MTALYPRLLVAFLVIAILVMDYALLFVARHDKESQIEHAEETLRRAVDTLTDELNVEFDLFSRTLSGIGEVIAAQGGMAQLDEKRTHRLLMRRNAITQNLRAIALIRPDGALAAHSINFPVTNMDFSDRDYFRSQVENFNQGFYIGHPVESRFDSTEIIPLSIRIESDGGLLLGVAAASIRSDRLAEILASLNLPGHYSLKLLLSNGSTLACFPAEKSCTQNNWSKAPLFSQHLVANNSGAHRQLSLFGEPAGLAAYKASEKFSFVVAGNVNPGDVLENWYQNLIKYLVIGLVSNLALIFLTLYSIRQFKARQRALAELHKTNLTLESRVLERTEELRRSEHRTRQIFAGSPVAMLLVNQDGRVARVNQQALSLFGGSESDLIGRIVEDFVPASLREQHEQNRQNYWQQPYTGMMTSRREFLLLKCDGSELPVEIGVALVDIDDEKFVVLAINDITERTKAQLELNNYRDHLEEMVHARTVELAQARDDAESASRAKSAILANMSHELRTPMHQIIGLAQIIQRRATDERQQSSLTNLLDASKRLMQLIEKLLDLAKIESGRLTIKSNPFDPQVLLHEVVERAQTESRKKAIGLLVEHDTDLPTVLFGDAYRLGEVFDCLVSNAIKFSSAGNIIIRTRLVERQPRLTMVRFEVQDQGIGINPEDQSQLFQSFTQVDDSQTRKFGGAGLGLSLSKRLVDLMGGQIGVQSTEGSGSTFWVQLSFPEANSASN